MIGLICIDVDGTLVGSSGVVSPEVWQAADAARDQGLRLAVCTGRPAFGAAREYAARLDGAGWHVFQNGASIVGLPSGDTRSRSLSDAQVRALAARAGETHRALELYADTEYAVEVDSPRSRQHADLLGVPFQLRHWRTLPGPIVRAQWVLSHAEAEEVLLEPHDGLNVAHSLSPVMPDTSFINITPAGVDKAFAVQRVAAEYGLTMQQVMMVGDGENDVTAMRAVGVAVAMGNAEPAVHAAAQHRVGHVDAGGLVEAITLARSLR